MSVETSALKARAFPSVWHAVLGGFLGTIGLTVLLYAGPMMGLPRMNLPTMLGTMFVADMGAAFWLGTIIHFIIGSVILALAYALFFRQVLPGQPWAKGAIYGLIPWLVLMVVVMPMLGAIHPLIASGMMMAPGFFASNLGPMAVVGALIAHLVYGVILGAVDGDR
jgi:uncharacterized membrane protein YagU involved in acid resistance